jgi:hypothetical protein
MLRNCSSRPRSRRNSRSRLHPHGKSSAWSELGVFFVDDIECRQGDVEDFLFSESEFVTRFVVRRHQMRCQPSGRCRRFTASDSDNPAAPNTGMTLVLCFDGFA